MPKYMKNIITLIGLILISSFLVFLYDCINGLAEFAGRFSLALTPWVFWLLFLSVAGMLCWAAAIAFIRPRPMLVYANPTDADLAEFQRILRQRLQRNRLLKNAGIRITTENEVEPALLFLKDAADTEIRSTAKQVFIGTAISQNGRLDTLVVLFLITRLAWRVSKIYNQRPHYRELINLYANIAVTSFLAGSIEECGIDEYVRELMGPLVGGSAIGAVPGAQAIAGAITASILTGSTNCLLALRCGIVARDYMSLNLDAKGAMRRSATLEASKMFVSLSAETVTYVTRVLVKSSTSAAKAGGAKVARGVGSAISGTAGAMNNSAKSVGRGVKNTAGAVSQGVKDTAGSVSRGVRQTKDSVTDSVAKARDVTRRIIRKASGSVTAGAESAVGGVDKVIDTGKEKARTLLERLRRPRIQK